MSPDPAGRRKILVFSSLGGGGHLAAWSALYEGLGDEFALERIDPFDTLLGPLDPFQRLSGGRLSGEGFYNFCMRRGWFGVASTLASRFGGRSMIRRARAIEQILFPHLDARAPDFLISVIPFLNGILLRYARQHGVPFLVLPVDLDARHYIVGIEAAALEGLVASEFCFALPFEDAAIRGVIAPVIPERLIRVPGFPVRADFHEPKNRAALRIAYGLPAATPAVMILMGAAGTTRMIGWAKAVAAAGIPLHLVLCAGRNDRLREHLHTIRLPDSVTRTVLGFTDRISDLMAASDLLLTKPGPGTIAEAVTVGLPMILDASGSILAWERLGIDFVVRRGFGAGLESRGEVGALVRDWLGEGERLGQCRAAVATLPRYDCLGAVRIMAAPKI